MTTQRCRRSRACDRLEIVDALYRFGLGQDLQDRELFASAFAADAELDFRPAAARSGSRAG